MRTLGPNVVKSHMIWPQSLLFLGITLYPELIWRKLAGHAAVLHQLVKLFESVLPDDAACRAAIAYSLISSCKAVGVSARHCQIAAASVRTIPGSGGYTLSQYIKTYFIGGLLYATFIHMRG